MPALRLSIGIVNYNSGYRLRQCIEALQKHPPAAPSEILVVDNDSHDGSSDFLKDKRPEGVRLIASPVNLLFTGGVNLAFAETTGEFFLILNPDMVACEGALDVLIRAFDEDPKLGAAGGFTVDRQDRFEGYLGDFPRPWQVFVGNYLPAAWKRREPFQHYDYAARTPAFSEPALVSAPTGGCVAFRRALFAGPPMSPDFGVFWSDAELARRIWATGYTIKVFPAARFFHDHKPREVNGEAPLSLVLDYLVGASIYFRRYEGRLPALELKVLLGFGGLVSLVGKHLPRALAGRESWTEWRDRGAVLRDFLRGRNALLQEAREAAVSIPDAHRVL